MALGDLSISPQLIIATFAGAVILGISVIFFIMLAAGPSTIIDGAMNVLNQSITTGALTVNSLLASTAGIVSEGFGVVASTISQTTLVMAQAAQTVILASGQIIAVGGTLVASTVMVHAAVITGTAQVLASAAAGVANIAVQFGAQIATLYLNITQVQAFILASAVQNGMMAVSAYFQAVFRAVAEIWTTLFTSLSAAVGQLLSIPMIAFYGYVSVGSTMITIPAAVISAMISIFTSLFSKFTLVFTDPEKFLAEIVKIPIKLGEAVINGFKDLLGGLGDALKSVFFP
jgi:hypothetical protein